MTSPGEPCGACGGRGTNVAFVERRDGPCGIEDVQCGSCRGTGLETPGGPERRAAGQAMRADRVARGLSLGDEARRLGCTVVELSRRERGLPP